MMLQQVVLRKKTTRGYLWKRFNNDGPYVVIVDFKGEAQLYETRWVLVHDVSRENIHFARLAQGEIPPEIFMSNEEDIKIRQQFLERGKTVASPFPIHKPVYKIKKAHVRAGSLLNNEPDVYKYLPAYEKINASLDSIIVACCNYDDGNIDFIRGKFVDGVVVKEKVDRELEIFPIIVQEANNDFNSALFIGLGCQGAVPYLIPAWCEDRRKYLSFIAPSTQTQEWIKGWLKSITLNPEWEKNFLLRPVSLLGGITSIDQEYDRAYRRIIASMDQWVKSAIQVLVLEREMVPEKIFSNKNL